MDELIGRRAMIDKGGKEAKQGLSTFSSISYRRSSANMRQAYDNFLPCCFWDSRLAIVEM